MLLLELIAGSGRETKAYLYALMNLNRAINHRYIQHTQLITQHNHTSSSTS